MHKLILILYFAFCFPFYGQVREISIYDADSISYEYFLNKNTKKLNKFTQEVLDSGLDFYYLRLRIGILNYNDLNYEYALPHFQKALNFAPEDSLSQEYLFYTYLFMNKKKSANSILETMTLSSRKRILSVNPSFIPKHFDIDSMSLSYYLTKNVINMTKLVENSKALNIDFYELQMRAGILNFEMKNYSEAEKFLLKALSFYPKNALVQEYLFYDYIELGKYLEANDLFKVMNIGDQIRLRKDKPYINSINFEGGYMTSSANSVIHNLPNLSSKLYEEKDVMLSLLYLHVGYYKLLKNKTSIYGGFSFTDLSKQKTISFPIDTLNTYHYKQTQLYFALTHTLKSRWELQFGLNGISYNALPTYAYFDTLSLQYRFFTLTSKALNIVSNFGTSKRIHSCIHIGFDLSLSLIDKQIILQEKLFTTFYPLKKASPYISLGFALSHDSVEVRNVSTVTFGGKLVNRFWNETYLNFGNMRNYNDANAFVVYNVSDKINFKIGTIFSFDINNKIKISLRYDLLQRQSSFYTVNYDLTNKSTTYKYNNNSIILGIKWKF
jgi:tetratricopeptide (TPR) repeat protein